MTNEEQPTGAVSRIRQFALDNGLRIHPLAVPQPTAESMNELREEIAERMKEDKIAAASLLRLLRTARGYESASQFALKHHIPVSTYVMHESGDRMMGVETACFYGRLLRVSPVTFLFGDSL